MRRPKITRRIVRTILAALSELKTYTDCDEEWAVMEKTEYEGRRRIEQATYFCNRMLGWMDWKKAQREG